MQKADFFVPEGAEGAFRSCQGRKAAIQIALWRPDTRIGFLLVRKADFLVPEGAEGLLWAPGADFFVKFEVPQRQQLASETRTPEGCSAHRISIPYTRSLFFAPSVFENTSRTPGGRFSHRMHIPYRRRPSPVPNATNTTQSHPAAQTTASSTPSLQPCPHYGHPPHGNCLGQETTALRKNLCNFFKKLRELSRSFFIFVPNKYHNTQ